MKHPLLATLVLSTIALHGCSTMISNGREEPIKEDYGSRTMGGYIDDQVIETKANVNISKGSAEVQHGRISITSIDGIVLLVGQVPTQAAKEEAGRIVQQVRDVKQVQNMLSVAPPATLVMQSQDTFITTQVISKLFSNKNVPSSQIKVITEAGIVYLMGRVTPQQANLAVDLIRQVGGVQQIVKVFEYI